MAEIADEAGLAIELDLWVIARATGQAREWGRAGRPVPVNVNVSAEMLRSGAASLVSGVEGALERTGLAPELLIIEINEQTLIEDAGTADALHRLSRGGVRLALDDFGVGNTSLTHLRRLPIGELKIDRSLVANLVESPEDRRILRAVADLAQILDLTVIAEGIENEAQAAAAQTAGAQVGQGFLFSPPLAAADVEALLVDLARN